MSQILFFFSLCCTLGVVFIAGSGMKSLFTEINSSSHTAVFCAQITYVFINILLLLI